MRILFWNTHRNRNINQYIVNLVRDYNIDILAIAEYSADKNELCELFGEYRQFLMCCNTIGCDRISIWSNYVDVKAGIQEDYYSIQVIQNKFVLCCVHLFTDLYGDHGDERMAVIQQIMHDIKKTEDKIKSQRTIIIGDFNEMPYDKGCLNANGFHGLPVLNMNDTPTRKVHKIEYRKFYNPMWNLMGDFSYPPGTYYKNQSKLYSPMWYMHDQVIVSQDMLQLLNKENLKIITSCSCADLMDKNQHPNKKISDHFPIMCEIREHI